jgi:hypothetical protein
MTTFDERERSFEKKFAVDQELRFKATARRDALLGEWTAAKLGLSGTAATDYVAALRKLAFAGKGGDAVLRKAFADLTDNGIAITASELEKLAQGFMAQALAHVRSKGESPSA